MTEINEDAFNMSLRKFLKQVGVTSQREIEKAVRDSNVADKTSLAVKMVVTVEGTDLEHVVEGKIDLVG